ncbi:MAG: hypothetical protein HRF46_15285 [Acidobacteriota bacterium]
MPSNPYRRMRRQMVAVLLAFGLVPLLAMGVAGYVANRAAIETRTRNLLEAMVKNRKATIDLFLEDRMRDLELVAASFSAEALRDEARLDALLAQLRREHGGIIDLGLIDSDGVHRAYVGPYNLRDRNYKDQDWFEHVMVQGRYESDVFLGFRRFPHMVMAVRKRDAGRDWVLRATIDTDMLSALVREGGIESGAEVFILNRAGEYQTATAAHHQLMAPSDLGPLPVHSGVRVVERRRGGSTEFIATIWLRGGAWVLVARQEAPGLSQLLNAHPAVLGVFIAGLMLVPLLARVVVRARLRQIRAMESERASLFESAAQAQKMAAIGRLAASVAHEINNPLAIIDAQVGVLTDSLDDLSGVGEASEWRARLGKIAAQVDRARKVTHRLLGFSRRVGPDIEPVDVAAALEETVSFVEREALASSIRIVREVERDVPLIRTSLAQMQQVFLNLINNAIDAVGSGGEVRTKVRAAKDGVEVTIADNGPGIPPRDLDRIFEPFFSTKAGERVHSGLGLAICKDVMQALGGRISVASTVGKGTCFTLWFPLDAEVGDVGPQATAG